MRPLRPACGTVLNAQLLTLPAIWRISAPGVVTTQLSSVRPASSSATGVAGLSDKRLATAHPPEPPPTTMKSKLSTALPPHFMDRNCLVFEPKVEPPRIDPGADPKALPLSNFWQALLMAEEMPPKTAIWADLGRHKILKSRLPALSKAASRWYIPLAPGAAWLGLPSQEASGRKPRLGALAEAVSGIGFSARLATI